MGVIVIYIYALIGFAFFRSSFDTEESRFCSTLWQCFVTVLRYGAVAELTEVNSMVWGLEVLDFVQTLCRRLVSNQITISVPRNTAQSLLMLKIRISDFKKGRNKLWKISIEETLFLTLQNLGLHPMANTFNRFAIMSIYQLSFFILFTTIGLNVIFGIIVDTFAELRDLKVSSAMPFAMKYAESRQRKIMCVRTFWSQV